MLQDQSRNRTTVPAGQAPTGAGGPSDATIARLLARLPGSGPFVGDVEPHPDAALLDLGRRFQTAEAAYRASLRRLDEMEAEHVTPERPEAIYAAPGDRDLHLDAYANEREPDGRRWYHPLSPGAGRQGLRRQHSRYEERAATEADRAPVGDVIARRVPWPEAQARADEIVAAYDGWVAECDRAEAACGLTAAYELSDRLGEALSDVETAIEDATASTLDGVLVKARFVQRDIDIGSETQKHLIRGLIRDLLVVGGAAPSPAQLNAIDPVLSGIAETRAALDRALAVEAASAGNLLPSWGAAVDDAVAALGRIEAPTTLAGAQAQARLTVDLRTGLALDLDDEMPGILERIAGGSVAPALALPAAASTIADATTPDADLIRLGAELDEAWAAERPLAEQARVLGTLEAEEPFDAAMDRTSAIVRQIAEATATTLAGLKVKARACSWCRSGQPFTHTTFNHQGTTDVALAAGVVRDLLAMKERDCRVPAAISTDLFGQIVAGWREWGALPDFDESEEGTAEYTRVEELRDALLDAAEQLPATPENLAVKTLAAAWLGYTGHWNNEQSRDQYGMDGRLILDIDTAICGRVKTSYARAAA